MATRHDCARRVMQIGLAGAFLWAANLYGYNEQLTIAQAPDRTISARIDGIKPACPSLIFDGIPVVTISGSQISVLSSAFLAAATCPNTPGGPQPFPYSLSAHVGIIPDGQYTLHWVRQPAQPLPPEEDALVRFDVQSRFVLRAGVLSIQEPQGVPVLSTPLMLLLGFVLVMTAWVCRVFPAAPRQCGPRRSKVRTDGSGE
jgi:hypothetical protein